MPAIVRSLKHITIVFDTGEQGTMFDTNPSFGSVIDAVKTEDWKMAHQLMFPATLIENTFTVCGLSTTIVNGQVFIDDEPAHGVISTRIIDLLAEGSDIKYLVRFIQRMKQNPSPTAITELYEFLEYSDIPITEDGYFLGYKRVRADYMDIYSGRINNRPGNVVVMDRDDVDGDSTKTCSTGLHFCSRDYLKSFYPGGDYKVVVLKIDPKDVVAIPNDYDNMKGRCCKYEVLYTLTNDNTRISEQTAVSDAEIKQTQSTQDVTPGIRGVIQLTLDANKKRTGTVDVFVSVREAMKVTGIDASSITKVCNGKRKTAGGYKWEWIS